MTGLTEQERESLRVACGFMRNANVETVVASIVAARVAAARADMRAKIEALADEWAESSVGHPNCDYAADCVGCAAAELRALLADLGGEPQ